jgi:putative PIN family toxin of toxin-antitoxin system
VKVVIDTNVFVSSLLNPTGSPRKVIDLWRFEKITLCLSKAILEEYFELLDRFRLTEKPMGEQFLRLFSHVTTRYSSSQRPSRRCLKITTTSSWVRGRREANVIVSGDGHLRKLIVQKIPILPPGGVPEIL